jgi:adenylate kinase
MRIVVLLGPPGCGKGTQAELIEKNHSLKKLSTGDILRDMANKEGELSIKLKKIMESGDLVSDKLIIQVIEKRLLEDDCVDGATLDGFPRTLIQAEYLDKMIAENLSFKDVSLKIISFELEDSHIVKRIIGRFTCKNCLAGYHDQFKPTKIAGVCDLCNSKDFFRRKDDCEEVVKNRLKNYHKVTSPIVKYYKQKRELLALDVNCEIGKIHNEVVSYIKK